MSLARRSPTRRQFALHLAGAALALADGDKGGYRPLLAAHTSIWRLELARSKRAADLVEEALATTRRAGFSRVQVMEEFLAPPVREKTLARLSAARLDLSIACASGLLHTKAAADAARPQVLSLVESLAGASKHIGFRSLPRPDGKPKTDDELRVESGQLNLLGEELARAGVSLIVEHEEAEMQDDAREWSFLVAHTDPRLVSFSLDVDCALRTGGNPWLLIDTARKRLRSVHLRNTSHGRAQETFGEGDIDMEQIATLLRSVEFDGFLVVELDPDPALPRWQGIPKSLALSLAYANSIFGTT